MISELSHRNSELNILIIGEIVSFFTCDKSYNYIKIPTARTSPIGFKFNYPLFKVKYVNRDALMRTIGALDFHIKEYVHRSEIILTVL